MKSRPLFHRAFLALVLVVNVRPAWTQCTNNNTAIAGGAITPPCPGNMIVPCVNAGQYALVNVTLGNIYEFATCDATYDTQITLYNNAGGGNVGSNDDACGLNQAQSIVVWTATFTGQLRVLVDRYVSFFTPCGHSGGCAPLSITCHTPAPAVTNNECAGAINLFVLPTCFSQTFSNVGATNSAAPPNPTCSFSGSARDVWFRFTAPSSGAVVIRTRSFSLGDAVMQLYSGACGSLVRVECDDDGADLMPLIDRRCALLTPGATYFIRVWGLGSTTGTFGLCVEGYDTFNTPTQDCSGGFSMCSSASISNASDFTGCTSDVNETNRGCLGPTERQGTWYLFSPQSTGTVAFVITPLNALGQPDDVDFDFAVWGPFTTVACPPATAPIRCSYAAPAAAGPWTTGLQTGNVDLSEDATGNGFVAPITVAAADVGKVYMVYIDNFNVNGQSFSLNWNLSAPNQLDCELLPVRIIDLKATALEDQVLVEWTAQDATKTAYFVVEHSTDGSTYVPVGTMDAQYTGTGTSDYRFPHTTPAQGINHYRLMSVDEDGAKEWTRSVSVLFKSDLRVLTAVPNPTRDIVHLYLGDLVHEKDLTIQVVDGSGRPVKGSGLHVEPPTVALDVQHLDAGCYLVILEDRNGEVLGTGRFIKE
jgi:hypothetical protein